ncbi:MAG: hypothetical protein ACF8AM_13465 [Rhodopirellula sp. JB055]|uniref:hypothetical protein n=1 Tax=Rhodopirellula sp. JB055 TaxID=3342846 RepID=UPI00370C7C84
MRVPRNQKGWQRWLRLDSLTEHDSMDVVRSWTVIVFPASGSQQEVVGASPAVDSQPMELKPRQVMTRVDMATLRSWCSHTSVDTTANEHSLLSWSWRHEDAPISKEAFRWQARLDCIKREIKGLREEGVDAIVLPIAKIESADESETSASEFDPEEDAMLVRLAANEMIQAEGQVWLEPPHLQCGAPVDQLVESWNAFWGQGQAAGFVVPWQSETIRCRYCGHHHATEALLPIIAKLKRQHLILVEDPNAEESTSELVSNEPSTLPSLKQTLVEIRRLQPERTTQQVWLVSDHRRESPPRLSSHFPVAEGPASEPAKGFWLGYQSIDSGLDGLASDTASLLGSGAVSMQQMDDQWIQWWDLAGHRAGRLNSQVASSTTDSRSPRFLFVDREMLESSSGKIAFHAWKNWHEELVLIPAKVADANQKSVDGLVTVALHPSSHSLILVNRAPWPMTVSLATTEETVWKTESKEEDVDLALTVPEQTGLGARLKLPPHQILVCQSESPLPSKIAWTGTVSDPATMMPRITEQVTMVVEHVGLLSELDRLPREFDSPSSDAERRAAPARSSIDRWNPGRVIQASTTLLRSSKQAAPQSFSTMPQSLLSNGGFEQGSLPDANARLGIPNWMHAQHPADAVKLDSRSAFRGEQSVRLAARDESGTQAWLISKNIATPIAGRVAISMAVRGYREPRTGSANTRTSTPPLANPVAGKAPQVLSDTSGPGNMSGQDGVEEPAKTLTLRVALEGSLDGQPCRHWREVEVPVNGKWQDANVVLEWLNIDVERTRDLRVTIDNLSDGIIWVDEIFVTDWFASRSERAELQSLAYLAVQGLQRDDVKASAQLLNHFWAQQLLQFAMRRSTDPRRAEASRPFVQPAFGRDVASPVAVAASSTAGLPIGTIVNGKMGADPVGTAEAPPGSAGKQPRVDSSQQNSGVTGKIRNWLPEPLRF